MSNHPCANCGIVLELVFPDSDPKNRQYEDALEIHFIGYYSGYFDDGEIAVSLCQTCANNLVEENPWLKNLLFPRDESYKFLLRSEETGATFAETLEEAFEKAKEDKTIWKISFDSANGDRVRLVTHDNGVTWVCEPVLASGAMVDKN